MPSICVVEQRHKLGGGDRGNDVWKTEANKPARN